MARRVIDEDADFRARVATEVDEERVGRAGWLFVTRPDGWQADVEALVQKASAAELAAKEDRAERGALRRLAGAEAAAARAEAAARSAVHDAQQARNELAAERAETAPLREALAQVRAELDEVRSSRSATIARLKETEAALATRSAEARALQHELRMAQAELAQTEVAGAGAGDRPAAVPAVPVEHAARDAAVAAALTRAVAATEAAAAALAETVVALDLPVPDDRSADGDESASLPREPTHVARARPLRARRTPPKLPPGVPDDGPEAAEHLVRVPGALLLVDGYNVSHAQWWAHPPAEQRSRLLDACTELHARCGVAIEVVFDGDGDTETAGSVARAGVQYRFTSAGVEADDVLLARVDEEPVDRAVIVASSDRRVRDGARRRGATVLGARQVLSVLRR